MGFPAEKLEGVYRNHIDDVIRFLKLRHNNNYRIYNLCLEKQYDCTKFNNNVRRFPFEDHNAPPFSLIYDFCIDARDYLNEDSKNTIVVHCKAGKGRTGVMIVCFLIFNQICSTFESALELYANQRTYNRKGVTIPSQIRYIKYFYEYYKYCIKNNIDMLNFYKPPTRVISHVIINSITRNFFSNMHLKIYTHRSECLHQSSINLKRNNEIIEFCIDPEDHTKVAGDFKLEFYHKDFFGRFNLLMKIWMNTFFIYPSILGDNGGITKFLKSTPPKTDLKYNLPSWHKSFQNVAETDFTFDVPNSNLMDWISFDKKEIDCINKDVHNKIFLPDLKIYVGFSKIVENLEGRCSIAKRISSVDGVQSGTSKDVTINCRDESNISTSITRSESVGCYYSSNISINPGKTTPPSDETYSHNSNSSGDFKNSI